MYCMIFFFNDTATTEIYTLSLHDALPISHTCPATTIQPILCKVIGGSMTALMYYDTYDSPSSGHEILNLGIIDIPPRGTVDSATTNEWSIGFTVRGAASGTWKIDYLLLLPVDATGIRVDSGAYNAEVLISDSISDTPMVYHGYYDFVTYPYDDSENEMMPYKYAYEGGPMYLNPGATNIMAAILTPSSKQNQIAIRYVPRYLE